MTEFSQDSQPLLGSRPKTLIQKLLSKLPFSTEKQGSIQCCELYVMISDVQFSLEQAIELGANLLSPAIVRSEPYSSIYSRC
jgi:hypothetical protein